MIALASPNPKAIGDIAEATINANFKGASWSKSIWKRQDKLRTIVAQEVYQAIIRGQNGLVIARNLRKDFVVNVSDAKRLAITEHARVQIEVAKQSMLRNGFEYYEVLPEPKACGVCKPKAGKKYRVDTMMTSETAPLFTLTVDVQLRRCLRVSKSRKKSSYNMLKI